MTTRIATLLLAVGLTWTIGTDTAWGADTWVQVTSPNFTVVSNASDKRAREVAWQFEQIRAAMLAIWPWMKGDLDRPVLVVAAKDENTMKLLAPEYWEERGRIHPDSVFVSAADRHYVALRADARAEDTNAINPYYASYWSYSSLLLDASFDRDLPLWLRNGLAGLLSNTIVRENEIRLGMAPPWYVRSISAEARLRLGQLFTMDSSAPYYRDPTTRARFDAQTWALLHYMLFGGPELSAKVNAVIKAVIAGTASLDAVQQAFGPLEPLESAYMLHVRKELLPYSRLKTETRISASTFASRQLPEVDALMSRAALHAVMRRPADAQALLAEARRSADPAAGHEVDAMMAAIDGNDSGARAALAKAEQLGSTNFYTFYRLAMMDLPERPAVDAIEQARQRFQKAVDLNPFHSGAHAMLANMVAMGPADQRARAVPLVQKAVSLDPGDLFTRTTIARALWNAGQRDVAMSQARAALGLATDDRERQIVQQLIDFFAKNLAAAPR
jgi:tetratricopeptide (TPR) repeat protein